MQHIKPSPGLGVQWLFNANLIHQLRGPGRLCHHGRRSEGQRMLGHHAGDVFVGPGGARELLPCLAGTALRCPFMPSLPPATPDDGETRSPACSACPRPGSLSWREASEQQCRDLGSHQLCHLLAALLWPSAGPLRASVSSSTNWVDNRPTC